MSFTEVTVAGRILNPGGSPASGTVSFRLSAELQDPQSNELRSRSLITATLDNTGAFSVALSANDDPGVVPSGSTYQVVERVTGAPRRTYHVVLTHTQSSVQLADLGPVNDGTLTCGVVSVNGRTGTVSLSATDVGADPVGTAAADVSTHAGASDPHGDRADAAAKYVPVTAVGVSVAQLVGGKVPSAQIPSLQWVRTHAVADQAAMLALTGVAAGEDIAIRQDGAGTFLMTGADPTQLASWTLLATPGGGVASVNGHSGTVVLTASDVTAQPADPDLTALAAIDASQAGVPATDGTGWIRKSYAALKTALGITAGDVSGLGTAATHPASDFDTAGAATVAVSTHAAATDPHADRAYTDAKVAALVNSAPSILDTLGELATQLQSDESAATALTTTVAGKQNVVVHGATAGTARPAGATLVHWVGSVAPTNGVTNDEWTDTTVPVTKRYNGSAWVSLSGTSSAPYTPTVATSGDTTGATDTAAINAALAANSHVVLSGDYYTNSALLMPSNSTLVLMDAAIHLAASSNDNVIRNSGAVTGTAQTNINITGIGRAIIDGNGSNQTRQTKLWKNHGILLLNVSKFRIRGLQVGPTNAYGLYIATCSQGEISSIRLNQDRLTPNQDGMDIIWGCTDISVDDISGTVSDDAIGLGTWDPTNLTNELPYLPGDLTDIRVSNVRVDSPLRAMRIINGDGHIINKIRVSGVHNSNSAAQQVILFGPSTLPAVAPTTSTCHNIDITDVSGRASAPMLCFDQAAEAVRISGVHCDGGATAVIGNQTVSPTLNRISVRDVTVQGAVTNLIKFTGGTITGLSVENVVADQLTKILSNGATVTDASIKNISVHTLNTCISDSTVAETGSINGVWVGTGSPRWTGAAPVLRFGTDMPTLTSADTSPAATAGSFVNCTATKVLDGGSAVTAAYRGDGSTWVRVTPASPTTSPTYGFQSQQWYSTPQAASLTTTATASGRATAQPFLVTTSTTFDQIAVNVTALGGTGSTMRLGIYADNGTGAPGTLVLDAGTVSTASAGTKTITISQSLGAGLYWLVARDIAVTSQPTVSANASNTGTFPGIFASSFVARPGWFSDSVANPLPASFGPVAGAASQIYFVMLRAL